MLCQSSSSPCEVETIISPFPDVGTRHRGQELPNDACEKWWAWDLMPVTPEPMSVSTVLCLKGKVTFSPIASNPAGTPW